MDVKKALHVILARLSLRDVDVSAADAAKAVGYPCMKGVPYARLQHAWASRSAVACRAAGGEIRAREARSAPV